MGERMVFSEKRADSYDHWNLRRTEVFWANSYFNKSSLNLRHALVPWNASLLSLKLRNSGKMWNNLQQSSSISSLAKTSFMEQKHAAGSGRTCWNTSWPRRVLSAVKFQRLYESARFSLKTILSPIDYNHVYLVYLRD